VAHPIAQQLSAMVPFVRTLGLEIGEVGAATATATLPDRPELHNHLGTAHAGAVYTLAESASGAVVLSIFGRQLMGPPEGRPFIALKESATRHRRARPGPVVAEARLDGDSAAVRAAYAAGGAADFEIDVTLRVGDEETGAMRFTWSARAPRA